MKSKSVIVGLFTAIACMGLLGLGVFVLLVSGFLYRNGAIRSSHRDSKALWQYQEFAKDRDTVIDTTGVTLIFEGVPCATVGTGGFYLNGTHGGTGGSDEVSKFETNTRNGAAILQLNNQTVEIERNGTILRCGSQTIDLTAYKKTVIIHKDNTMTVSTK